VTEAHDRDPQTADAPAVISLMMGIPSSELAMLGIMAGCDSVILDCEHGFPFDRSLRTMAVSVHSVGGRCITRVPRGALDRISSIADMGMDGFVLSGVQTMQDMAEAMSLARFPPAGSRSVNPFVPAAGIPGDVPELKRSAAALQFWAMAETEEFLGAVKDLTAADATHPGWTGIIIGPYDLSAALGCSADPQDPILADAVRAFMAAARRLTIKSGLFVRDAEHLRQWRAQGISTDMVCLGYDRYLWYQGCQSLVSAARSGN
jgi:2-keto-3-deoxy-L-rhamnonate aldolase RhmA